MKQAYAIVRHDKYYSKDTPIEHKITIKKVVLDLAYAEEEVKRLNELNGDHDCYYFWQYTRIEEDHERACESHSGPVVVDGRSGCDVTGLAVS